MEVNAQLLEKHLKKSSLISNIISISVATITAIGVGTGFYFSTKNTLERHETDLQEIKTDVKDTKKELTEIQVYKGISSEEIKNLEKKVDDMDDKIDRLLILTQRENR